MFASENHPALVRLLQQLRSAETPAATENAWQQFAQLYTPLLFSWARKVGARADDAADLVQDVFVVLTRRLPTFRYDPIRSFCGWLWTILLNKWRDYLRDRPPAFVPAEQLEAVAANEVERIEEAERRSFLIARVLEIMEAELPPCDCQACREYMVRGRPAGEVATELGMSVNQIYLAKSRILPRLRAELEGLLDCEPVGFRAAQTTEMIGLR